MTWCAIYWRWTPEQTLSVPVSRLRRILNNARDFYKKNPPMMGM